MLKSILPLSIATFLSRITGFIRDYALYQIIKPGPTLDLFFLAFKFPQLTRRFFAEGSFHQALLPVMGETLKSQNSDRYLQLYSQSFWFLTLCMTALTLSMIFGGELWVNYLLAPGFSQSQQAQLIEALYWTTPYSAALSWISLYALVLQLHHSYWLNGFSPTLLNLVVIWAAWAYDGSVLAIVKSIFWVGWLQVAIQVYSASKIPNNSLKLRGIDFSSNDFRTVMHRFTSLSGLSLLIFANVSIDQIFLSYAPVGSISVYYICERMIELPIGILGYSLWSVFSTYYVRLHHAPIARIRVEHKIILLIIFLLGPATAGIFLFAPEVMAFFIDPNSPLFIQSVNLLHIVSLQILMIVLNKIFVIIFTTNKRNGEILRIHLIGSVVNLVANSILYPYGARGIAFSTVLTLLAQLSLFHMRYPLLSRLKRLPRSLLFRPFCILLVTISVLVLCSSLSKYAPRGILYLPILSAILLAVMGLYLASMRRFFEYLNHRVH